MLQVDISSDDSAMREFFAMVPDVLREAFERLPERPPGNWALTVRLARSAEISDLHAQFFGDPADTDVMSFPSEENLRGGCGYLGDIAISLDVAGQQAVEQEHSLIREVVFLALHGMLHLLGHTDDTRASREAMLQLQTRMLREYERKHGVLT